LTKEGKNKMPDKDQNKGQKKRLKEKAKTEKAKKKDPGS
jgi:hypothetical protein